MSATIEKQDTLLSKNRLKFPELNYNQLPWYTEQDIPEAIPVLDYQQLLSGKDWHTIEKILHQGIGFYIKNIGITDQETESLINITRKFCNRPESEKQEFIHPQITPIWRGYSTFRVDRAADLPADQKAPTVTMNYAWGKNRNVYPHQTFRQIWQNFYAKKSAIVHSLTEIIVEILSLRKNNDWKKLFGGEPLMRYQCYPAIAPQAAYRVSPHVDTSIITLLSQIPSQSGYVGLEVWAGDQFIKAPAVKGTAVVNIGEVLFAFTKGAIKPTEHRVVNPLDNFQHSERTSIPIFYHAAKDLEILCPQGSTRRDFYNHDGKTTVETFLNNAIKCFSE